MVIFLCAISRPRWHTCTNRHFDGKIGIWSFITCEPAQRSSSMVANLIILVTAEVYRNFLTGKFLPAISEKWPRNYREIVIKLQQDNVPAHIKPDNPTFLTTGGTAGLYIQLVWHTPKIPDLNVLDPVLFNSIQSLQHTKTPRNTDQLIRAIRESLEQLHSSNLNNIFLTIQKVIDLWTIHNVSNNYKLSYISKASLEREGLPPVSIKCSEQLLEALNA